VVPVASDQGLRTRAWIEANRRRVDELSVDARVCMASQYRRRRIQLLHTLLLLAQQKDGAIIDERYNQGGMVADYIVNELDRKLLVISLCAMGRPRHHRPPDIWSEGHDHQRIGWLGW